MCQAFFRPLKKFDKKVSEKFFLTRAFRFFKNRTLKILLKGNTQTNDYQLSAVAEFLFLYLLEGYVHVLIKADLRNLMAVGI
jgi:hypothetical protein